MRVLSLSLDICHRTSTWQIKSQRGQLGELLGTLPPSRAGLWGAFCQARVSVLLLFQATVHMDGGKIVVDFPNYHQTSEVVGDKLVEVSVLLVLGTVMRTSFCLQPWPLRDGPLGPGFWAPPMHRALC